MCIIGSRDVLIEIVFAMSVRDLLPNSIRNNAHKLTRAGKKQLMNEIRMMPREKARELSKLLEQASASSGERALPLD